MSYVDKIKKYGVEYDIHDTRADYENLVDTVNQAIDEGDIHTGGSSGEPYDASFLWDVNQGEWVSQIKDTLVWELANQPLIKVTFDPVVHTSQILTQDFNGLSDGDWLGFTYVDENYIHYISITSDGAVQVTASAIGLDVLDVSYLYNEYTGTWNSSISHENFLKVQKNYILKVFNTQGEGWYWLFYRVDTEDDGLRFEGPSGVLLISESNYNNAHKIYYTQKGGSISNGALILQQTNAKISGNNNNSNDIGSYSISFGEYSTAKGKNAIAVGMAAKATGNNSSAFGSYIEAASQRQHVVGYCNILDSNNNFVEIVGNGGTPSSQYKSNARAVDWNGNEYLKGTLYVNCTFPSNGSKPTTKNEVLCANNPLLYQTANWYELSWSDKQYKYVSFAVFNGPGVYTIELCDNEQYGRVYTTTLVIPINYQSTCFKTFYSTPIVANTTGCLRLYPVIDGDLVTDNRLTWADIEFPTDLTKIRVIKIASLPETIL